MAACPLIVVLEPNRGAKSRVHSIIQSLGYQRVDAENDQVRTVLAAREPAVVLASLPSQDSVVRGLRDAGLGSSSLLVSLPSRAPASIDLVRELNADGFVHRPYRWESLAAVLHSCVALHDARKELAMLGSELDRERQRGLRSNGIDPRTHFFEFDFFKQMLLFEILRAKRYGYALSICLIALDPLPHGNGIAAEAGKELETTTAIAIRSGIRDIDIPVHYTTGKYLVFLPHTDAKGAERVGRRVHARIRRALHRDETGFATASIGIAGLRPEKGVSFSRLIRDAGTALKAAQLKGGNQVILRQ